MTKEFSKFFIANLKRTAQIVNPLVKKKEKLQKAIAGKQAELAEVEADIAEYQGPIMRATGGYTTEDLITRTVVESTDKEGKIIKQTRYELTYPETVIPPAEEETSIEVEKEELPFMTEDVMNPSNEI